MAAAGYPVVLADVMNMAGSISVGLRNALEKATDFNTWLNLSTHNNASGYLLGLGLSDGPSETLLRNSISDLATLNLVAKGLQATGASNFFANAAQLQGLILR